MNFDKYFNELILIACNDSKNVQDMFFGIQKAYINSDRATIDANSYLAMLHQNYNHLPIIGKVSFMIDILIRGSLTHHISKREKISKTISEDEIFMFLAKYDAYLYQFMPRPVIEKYYPELVKFQEALINEAFLPAKDEL